MTDANLVETQQTEDHLGDDQVHVAEIYLAVNENGEYDVGTDSEDATDRLKEYCGGEQVRVICLNIDVTALVPEIANVEAALPKREDGTFELQIKS